MTNSADDLRATLRENGLRATAQRIAVLGVLRRASAHYSVREIAREVRERLGTVSRQTVYDALESLSAAGLARRIEPAGGPALFESRVADNHHHVVCRRCGAVADIDCAMGSAPCLEASDTRGFLLDEAEITFRGLCPDCQTRPDRAADAPRGQLTVGGTRPSPSRPLPTRTEQSHGGRPEPRS